MGFEKIIPTEQLRSYIKYLVVATQNNAQQYTVLPTAGMVVGFQYSGSIALVDGGIDQSLATAGITGIRDTYKVFSNTHNTCSILVYFTETGVNHFTSCPANNLFNLSISLQELFDKNKIAATEDKLSSAKNDAQRIRIIEQFFFSQLKHIEQDKIVVEAVKRIYHSKGNLRIKQLAEDLYISQSPFEKRFRKVVGTSPKKFANIVRFNTVLNDMGTGKSLPDICYEHHFFDQAHFIKDFKRHTGTTPDDFRQQL